MKPALQARDKHRAEQAASAAGARGGAEGRSLLASVLRAEWRRVQRVAELFPWTPLGLSLTLLAYAALEFLAHAELDLVWLVVGYVGLGLTVVSPLLVLLAAGWLKLRGPLPDGYPAQGEPLVLETGVAADTGFRMPLPWYVPLVQLRWHWVEPCSAAVEQRRKGGALLERVTLDDRGRFAEIDRRVVLMDPFGLSRVVLRMPQARAVDVLPRLSGLTRLPSLQAFASGDATPHPMGLEDGDRLELRRYTPGDPARFIHWKVLSRTRKLMVRTPERALSIARRTAAFLIAGQDDDATAAVARLAIERRLLGTEWLFGTDLELGGADDVRSALDALMRSSAARGRGGEGLSAFLERAEREGPTSVLVFAPSRPGPWVERVVAAAHRRKLRVVIGIDGVYERARPPLLARLLAFHAPPQGTHAAELEQVLRTLGQAGAQVTVLDRGSGRVLGTEHRRAMRAAEPAVREAS